MGKTFIKGNVRPFCLNSVTAAVVVAAMSLVACSSTGNVGDFLESSSAQEQTQTVSQSSGGPSESMISQEELASLEKEKSELRIQAETKQKELEKLKASCERLGKAREEDWEEQIRDAYGRREEAVLEAEALLLFALSQINMVTLETSDFQEIFLNGLTEDVIGNEILSSSVKSAIQAASDDMSTESILDGVRTGTVTGIQEYVSGYAEGKAKDYLTDKIGADIFSAAGLVNQLVDAEDTPSALANGIAKKQEKQADAILKIIQAPSMEAGDIRLAAERLYQLKTLEAEASEITGNYVEGNRDALYDRLTAISQQYGIENYRILKYAEWKEDAEDEE